MDIFLRGFQPFAAYIGVAGIYRGGMDNDGIHKFAYRLRALFTDLLRLVAPALEKDLDFDRAVELPTSQIEPAGGRLAQRHGDIAWRVPRRDGGDDGWGAWVVVLVEFQSTVHWNMAKRMREYSRMARQRFRKHRRGAPAVLPIVLYNGNERWKAPGAVRELPASWATESRLVLAPFQGGDYVLYSLERLRAEGTLVHLPLQNRAAATLRLQAERTPEAMLARFTEDRKRFDGPADAATRQVLYAWTEALLENAGAKSVLQALSMLEGTRGEAEMATVSEVLLGNWREQVRAEHVAEGFEWGVERGIEQGVERGIEQGVERGIERGIQEGTTQERARGLARLRRQAAIKFGKQTSERLSHLLADAVATDQMGRLEDSVSEWIVECERGDDLLSRVSALGGNGRSGP